MQVLVANRKGGCGKSTLCACLALVLEGSIIVHDPQGTISVNAKFTGRFSPPGENLKEVVIHDTLPYRTKGIESIIRESDHVIVPTKMTYPNVLALASIVQQICDLGAEEKSIIVFNQVRHLNRKLSNEVFGIS